MTLRKLFLGLSAGLAVAIASMTAQAQPTTELALGIDRSGSISDDDFDLQLDAYVNVLGSVLPVDGSVAVGVWSFGGDPEPNAVREEFALTTIDSTNISSLTGAIGGITRIDLESTALGPAIETAAAALTGSPNPGAEKLIDVSTDGQGNQGIDEDTAADNAIGAGVDQVNCLGVGTGADCGFVPTGSLTFTADSFGDFEAALDQKIRTETGQVPVPAPLLLFGAGLLALGFARGRRT